MRAPEPRLRALALVPAIGLALDQRACDLAAELEHHECGDLVGGVLLAAEHRQPQQVRDGVAALVQQRADNLADDHLLAGDALGRRHARRTGLDVGHEFVAEGDRGIGRVVEGVDLVALLGAQLERDRQLQRRQELAELLQHLARLQPLHDGGVPVVGLDVGVVVGCLRRIVGIGVVGEDRVPRLQIFDHDLVVAHQRRGLGAGRHGKQRRNCQPCREQTAHPPLIPA
jgi:hypothetical protein